MIALGIDTSGLLGGVALARDGRLLGEVRCDARAAASERILPQIDRLLADLGLGREALVRIGVALGPGSFTGVRVGLATAKGLAVGLGLPLVGVSSLAARIAAVGAGERAVLAALAPRRGEVFCAVGHAVAGSVRWVLPEASRPLADAALWVAAARAALGPAERPLLCVGDGVTALLEALDAAPGGRPVGGLLALVDPAPGARPGLVALWAARAPASALCTGAELDALIPRYLRGSYARPPGSPAGGRTAGGAAGEVPGGRN